MKIISRKYLITFIVLLIILTIPTYVSGVNDEDIVYVIPIKGEINPAVTQFVRNSIEKVEQDPDSVAIIFEIDTLGGMIEQATSIRDAIMGTGLKTISFVNNRAESAGVILTIASENIVMAKGSTVGSAETIPYTEKNISYWKSELRSTAEQRGRDPRIVEAMADRRMEIEDPIIEGKLLVQEGELLNLTSNEAERIGFTDFIGNTYEEILDSLNIEYTEIVRLEQNFKLRVAQMVTSSVALPIILTIGFVGLIVELFTPGFGIGGTISLLAFITFFGGSILAGNAGIAIVLVFITGLILLLIEALIPGFGAPGIGGIICIITSIVLASDSVALGITSLIIAFVITVVVAILLLKYAPKNKYFDNIILGTELRKDMGYTSTVEKNSLLGKEGIALTPLRPSGIGLINNEKVDVVTEGEYIEKGRKIKVLVIEGRKVVVRKID